MCTLCTNGRVGTVPYIWCTPQPGCGIGGCSFQVESYTGGESVGSDVGAACRECLLENGVAVVKGLHR